MSVVQYVRTLNNIKLESESIIYVMWPRRPLQLQGMGMGTKYSLEFHRQGCAPQTTEIKIEYDVRIFS
jgi:hypothetical protein